MLAWLSAWSEVQTCILPSRCQCHSLSLASVKSRLVLHLWYRLTWVVPDKGPLNGCVCVCVCLSSSCVHVLCIRLQDTCACLCVCVFVVSISVGSRFTYRIIANPLMLCGVAVSGSLWLSPAN